MTGDVAFVGLAALLGVTALVTSALASRRAVQSLRRSWLVYGAGILALIVSVLVVAATPVPAAGQSPWVALTVRAVGYALLALSLHWSLGVRRSPRRWLLLSLDGFLVGGSAFLLVWTLAVDPREVPAVARGLSTATWLGDVVVVVADLLLASVVVGLAARTQGRDRRAPVVLAVASVALGTADMSVLLAQLAGPSWLTSLARVTWLVAAAAAAVAPVVGRVDLYTEAAPEHRWESIRRWPHPVVALTIGVVLAAVGLGRPADGVALAGGFALLGGTAVQMMLLGAAAAGLLRRLKVQADRTASLLAHSSDIIMVADMEGLIGYVSPAVRTLLGHEPDALVGRDWTSMVHPDDVEAVHRLVVEVVTRRKDLALIECRLRHADGGWRVVESTASALPEGERSAGVIVNARDVTDRVTLERELEHRATHDELTGLPNRGSFIHHLNQVLDSLARGRRVAVVYLDLDGFKAVNDSSGHAVGDALLVQAGRRLEEALRAGDVMARFGGDEFAAILPDTDPDVALSVAERLRRTVSSPYLLDGREIVTYASVGIALSGPGLRAEDMLRNADLAMYRAKESGRNRVEMFAPQMHEALVRRVTLESQLRRALEDEQFEVHYQPVVDLDTGAVPRVEALVRWRLPDGSLRMPGEFIPVAEDSGLVVPLGRWVLDTALDQAARWHSLGLPVGVTVNLSARQLDQPGVVSEVLGTLERTGVDPTMLTLEVTESALLRSVDLSRHRLTALRERGVSVALDDFGTGYSGLSYLRGLTVDIIKLDREFIAGLGVERERTVLVRTLTTLARDLGLITIAEGVETAEQAALLRSMGCPWAQGFLFARPAPAERVTGWLRDGFSLTRLQ